MPNFATEHGLMPNYFIKVKLTSLAGMITSARPGFKNSTLTRFFKENKFKQLCIPL